MVPVVGKLVLGLDSQVSYGGTGVVEVAALPSCLTKIGLLADRKETVPVYAPTALVHSMVPCRNILCLAPNKILERRAPVNRWAYESQ